MDSAQSYQQQQQYEEQMSVQQQQQQQFQQQSYEEHQRVSFAEETCEYCFLFFFCIAKSHRILISLMTFKKIFQACYFLQHQTINVRIRLL